MKTALYLLILAFLAFSINCSTKTENGLAAAESSASDSEATVNLSANKTSEKQNTAPDAVVKELYKLHDAGKSPLYERKNRAQVEKFFSKDFVNLIWQSGEEPNLMHKLPIEGDALYGITGLGKSKNLNVSKAQIDGNKASVIANFEVAEGEEKYEKSSALYEMVKENSGWRIADIKISVFYGGSLVALINNLKKMSEEESKELDKEFENIKPPFVGTRWFNISPQMNGSGTPQYYLKINSENYMFCGFVQINQADGTETKEEVALGKFKKVFDCNFKNNLGESGKYKIEGKYIYSIDKNDNVVKSEVCCKVGDDSSACECKSEFYESN